MKAVATLVILAAAFAAPAWASGSQDAAVARGLAFDPTLEMIQANVFTPSCALSFCHGEAMSANLDLRSGNSYSNLVNVPSVEISQLRVEPFNADASYLICKMEICPEMEGSQMPLIGGPVPQDTIDVIRAWIDAGAAESGPISVEESTWSMIKSVYHQ